MCVGGERTLASLAREKDETERQKEREKVLHTSRWKKTKEETVGGERTLVSRHRAKEETRHGAREKNYYAAQREIMKAQDDRNR